MLLTYKFFSMLFSVEWKSPMYFFVMSKAHILSKLQSATFRMIHFFPFAKGPEAGGNAKERPHHWQETANLQLRACSQSSNGWARLLPAVPALSLRIARCLHWIMFFSMRSTERFTLRWIYTAFCQTLQSTISNFLVAVELDFCTVYAQKIKAVSWWRRPLYFQQALSQEKASLSLTEKGQRKIDAATGIHAFPKSKIYLFKQIGQCP